jgi:hypothetical protein
MAFACASGGSTGDGGGLSVSDATSRCQSALDRTVRKMGGIAGTVVIDSATVNYTEGSDTLTAHVTDPQDGNVSMGDVACTGLIGATTAIYNMQAA